MSKFELDVNNTEVVKTSRGDVKLTRLLLPNLYSISLLTIAESGTIIPIQRQNISLGTKPFFNSISVSGSGWKVFNNTVLLPLTGMYQISIIGSFKLTNTTSSNNEFNNKNSNNEFNNINVNNNNAIVSGSVSTFATLECESADSIVTGTLSTFAVAPIIITEGFGSAITNSFATLLLTSGSLLSFWANSKSSANGLMTANTNSNVFNTSLDEVTMSWYSVNIVLLSTP